MTMRWSNVLTIFRREVRDQMRDRRTLFMIFILPIMLYPILGIGISQFLTAFEQKLRTVVVVGAEDNGLSRLVNETCDQIVSIPMSGNLESLNAGVAASVALYAVSRSRA